MERELSKNRACFAVGQGFSGLVGGQMMPQNSAEVLPALGRDPNKWLLGALSSAGTVEWWGRLISCWFLSSEQALVTQITGSPLRVLRCLRGQQSIEKSLVVRRYLDLNGFAVTGALLWCFFVHSLDLLSSHSAGPKRGPQPYLSSCLFHLAPPSSLYTFRASLHLGWSCPFHLRGAQCFPSATFKETAILFAPSLLIFAASVGCCGWPLVLRTPLYESYAGREHPQPQEGLKARGHLFVQLPATRIHLSDWTCTNCMHPVCVALGGFCGYRYQG